MAKTVFVSPSFEAQLAKELLESPANKEISVRRCLLHINVQKQDFQVWFARFFTLYQYNIVRFSF